MEASTLPAALDGCEVELDGECYRYLVLSVPQPRSPGSLTRSERDIARRAALGDCSRAIALARGTSRRTVDSQLGSIFRKLGIASRAELCERLFSEQVAP